MTRRQQIARLLREGSMGAEEIARELGARARTVLSDLEHVRRGLRPPARWLTTPARCLRCGFTFHGRARLATPSRCPHCRSEDIEPARFAIEGG